MPALISTYSKRKPSAGLALEHISFFFTFPGLFAILLHIPR